MKKHLKKLLYFAMISAITALTIGGAFGNLAPPDDREYFPNRTPDARLALTASGQNVFMTYTPATYLFTKTKSDIDFIEFEIRGGILHKGWEDFTSNSSANIKI